MKQFNNSTIKLSGFTLIEILVTIGILIIMSTLAVFSFTNSNSERQLNLTAEDIIGQLQQAQSLAFTGAKQGVAVPNGYGFYLNYTTKQYFIYADIFGNNGKYDDPQDTIITNLIDISSDPNFMLVVLDLEDFGNMNFDIDTFFNVPDAKLKITAGVQDSNSVRIQLVQFINGILKMKFINIKTIGFGLQ